MELKIYNTLGRELQDFRQLDPERVNFYQCGPTVYGTQHIGNLRAMVMADLVYRTLLYFGYEVRFVRNYTDVGHLTDDGDEGEEKMDKSARKTGNSPLEIANASIAQFEHDVTALNTLPANAKPRATDYIAQMISMVEELLAQGFAYSTPKAIYFDTSKAKDYTRLSGQKLDQNQQGAGSGGVSDSAKRNPADFAVWFFKTGVHEHALQTWESPFESPEIANGRGFPGWHLECSAMARAELADTIDIHMGGIEHIPVHHTNEIAQSEAVTGERFANYWIHNEWLMINSEKISKSLGNSVVLADITAENYHPLDLRYFFLGAHYRSRQNFTYEALTASQTARKKLLRELKKYADRVVNQGSVLEIWRLQFIRAIGDDFNLPKGLSVVWDLLSSDTEPEDKLETILDFDSVLGLDILRQLEGLNTGANQTKLDSDQKAKIEELIRQRNSAREAGDFAQADALRDKLAKDYGVELRDTNGETTWKLTS